MHVLSDGFVQMASKRVRRGEITPLGSHRHEAVGINDVDFAGDDGQGRVENVLRVVGGVIVNDAHLGVLEPTFEQARCFSLLVSTYGM